jgi:hypothetical protein
MSAAYAIDLYSGNYYPGFTLPLADMKAHGFRAACIKASTPGDKVWVGGKWFDTAEFFTNYFRAGGFDVFLYAWVDPIIALQQQILYFANQCKRFGVTVGMLDWEQDWADWAKYDAYCRHEIPGNQVPKLPPAKIINAAAVMLSAPELQFLKQLELYTYATFPLDKASLTTWPFLRRRPWIAAYPTLPAERVVCETWQEFEDYTPEISPIDFTRNRPMGLKSGEWSWWQFQSGIWLPGAKGHYDLSAFNGTEADYNAWVGKVSPAPVPAPVPLSLEQRVISLEQRVHALDGR